MSPVPAKFIIDENRVYIENSNKPNGIGAIDPDNFSPYPKNPIIAKFFKEIGWVDELGSGVRNIYKYNKIYSNADPKFIEGDIFKTIIPLNAQTSTKIFTSQDEKITQDILEYCKSPRSRQNIQDFIGVKDSSYFVKRFLNPLIEDGLLKRTIPNKPTSPNQQYYSKGY